MIAPAWALETECFTFQQQAFSSQAFVAKFSSLENQFQQAAKLFWEKHPLDLERLDFLSISNLTRLTLFWSPHYKPLAKQHVKLKAESSTSCDFFWQLASCTQKGRTTLHTALHVSKPERWLSFARSFMCDCGQSSSQCQWLTHGTKLLTKNLFTIPEPAVSWWHDT